MEQSCDVPRQMRLPFDDGDRLLNSLAARFLRLPPLPPAEIAPWPRAPGGESLAGDAVARGVATLQAQCLWWLHTRPLQRLTDAAGNVHLRVCGALDYVIDRRHHVVFGAAVDVPDANAPDLAWSAGRCENIAVLRPLCTPRWLDYLACRPEGVFGARGAGDPMQLPLWQQRPDTMQALPEIRRIVDARLRRTLAFRRLRAALAYWLVRCIDQRLVALALRARTTPGRLGLSSPQMGDVWLHRSIFERVAEENPRLLPAVAAWLSYPNRLPPGAQDAVPWMRTDLRERDLPPKAWRYLAVHGTRCLTAGARVGVSWVQIVRWLRALENAHWPVPPPRGWIGMLDDQVGVPTDYDQGVGSVPGWFWNWVCTAAHACAHDAAALAQHESECTWGGWLAPVSWRTYRRLQVVPLLSARDVYDEGQALHNCAADYVEDCRADRYLMISLREPGTGRRVALLGLARAAVGEPWEWHQLAGPCNRSVPAWVHRFAQGVARKVRQVDDPSRASSLAA